MITEGKMQYLFDEKGKRYLDVSDASNGSNAIYQPHECQSPLDLQAADGRQHRLLRFQVNSAACNQ
jgi:acetylornithine/succinyldiaminopimelate/putrescine aminotransferase